MDIGTEKASFVLYYVVTKQVNNDTIIRATQNDQYLFNGYHKT